MEMFMEIRSNIRAIVLFALLFTPLFFSSFVNAESTHTVTYYHYDALGSIVAASDEEGDVIWRKSYDSHGNEIINTDDGRPYEGQAYTGKPYDEETGLIYLGQRYYDPELKRFFKHGPSGLCAKQPHQL